ncbi:MAG: type II toxin-antitoxin system prevent-host-death family antitoxin [Candidatus Accumulibacter sp.]|jgi:prevent-host-death family protein|nr:type II toxin-antitoxin system prevent-host-death family antitoxin [Accumulibacter sp.]
MLDPKMISIGQLRQNPTQMIRDVRAGEVYVLTDRGQPVADITPHREYHGVSSETLAVRLRELAREFGPDPDWIRDIEAARDCFEFRNPWESKP